MVSRVGRRLRTTSRDLCGRGCSREVERRQDRLVQVGRTARGLVPPVGNTAPNPIVLGAVDLLPALQEVERVMRLIEPTRHPVTGGRPLLLPLELLLNGVEPLALGVERA